MAKFTKTAKKNGKSIISKGTTINKEGAPAFELKDKERLVTGVLTCFVNEPKFYGDTTGDIKSVAQRVCKHDPEFVAKLAAYSRNVFHMRSVSQMLISEVAILAKGNSIIRKATRAIIERPDDMTNIISYHLNTYGPRTVNNPIPAAIRRGIADSFNKFDEYQLAKYKGDTNDVKLKDALLISHPKPKTNEQGELWKRLIEGKLQTPKTRETVLSEKGQSKEVWEEMIESRKLGYMALLRNLKNMLSYGVSDDHIEQVIKILGDPERVKKSKQLPFRFFSAYKMIEDNVEGRVIKSRVLNALDDALEVSFSNIEKLPGTTAIITDESASMRWSKISSKSIIRSIDIGNLLGAAINKFSDNGIVIPFGETAKLVHLSERASVIENMSKLENSDVGHATYLEKAFAIIDKLDAAVDRVIIFSDMQCYSDINRSTNPNQSWVSNYRKRTRKDTWIHSIDLQGHGTTQVIGNRVNLIAGWSDKVLEYISKVENGGSSLVETIENYELH